MITEIFISPEFIRFVTLDNWRFYLVFFGLLGYTYFQGIIYSRDPVIQSVFIRISIVFFLIFFSTNTYLSQLIAINEYNPNAVGLGLIDSVRRGEVDSQLQVERLLFREFYKNSHVFIFMCILIFVLGYATFRYPQPRWVDSIGVLVIDNNIKSIVDYLIFRLFLRNFFIYSVFLALTVVSLDLAIIGNAVDLDRNPNKIKNYLGDTNFDDRFFVISVIAMAGLGWAFGTLGRLRFRMIQGDLHGYRHKEIMRLVSRHRKWSRRRRPRYGQRARTP